MTGYDLREELEEIGVSKQFLGRVPYIVHMDRLSRAQLRQILVDKEHGVFGKKQKWFKRNGKTLTYDEDLVEEILDMVAKQFNLNENELYRYRMDKDNVASFK